MPHKFTRQELYDRVWAQPTRTSTSKYEVDTLGRCRSARQAMVFEMADINGWKEGISCTLTALAGVSGKTPDEIALLLSEVATERGRPISEELHDDYNINDWLEVVNRLGGSWAAGEDYSNTPFSERQTIDEWMLNCIGSEPELVFCDDGDKVGHVFATVEGDVVDTYTGGKRVKFTAVPPAYSHLRVKLTFLVEAANS